MVFIKLRNRPFHWWRFTKRVPKAFDKKLLLLGIIVLWAAQTAQASQETATGLTVTVGGIAVTTVPQGSAVLLTATVMSSGKLVTSGQVNLCDATAKSCTDIHLLGTAQLTPTGIATLKFVSGPGGHSYKAVFKGTNSYSTSTSASAALFVVAAMGPINTTVGIQASGGQGNYSLLATVATNGPASPTGQASFVDTSNTVDPDYVLGTTTLGPTGSDGITFYDSFNYPTPLAQNGGAIGGSIVTADFNGDGIPDIAVATGESNQLILLLGTGNGAFTSSVVSLGTIGAGGPGPILTADFNSDGKADLAVAVAEGIEILLGNGDGTFQPGFLVSGAAALFAAGDINGDGVEDLVGIICNSSGSDNCSSANVTVFLGNGDGTFNTLPQQVVGSNNLFRLALGDFNGDGKLDLAFTSFIDGLPQGELNVLLGNGDGTFGPENTVANNNAFLALALGDVNGDGNLDIVATNQSPAPITVLLGKGDGTFTTAANSPATAYQSDAVALADFNGDGIPDLVLPDPDGGTTNVFLGKGDGTFVPDVFSPSVANFIVDSIAIADFNGDGQSDIAEDIYDNNGDTVVQDQVSVLLSQAPNTAAGYAYNISPVGMGFHYVDASYAGDANNLSGLSTTTPLLAEQVPTNLTLTVSPSGGSAVGQPVTLTASLDQFLAQDHYASGNVKFTSNGKTLGTAPVQSNGTATLTTTALTAGTDNLKAVYPGDINFLGSTAAIISYPVSTQPLSTVTTLTITAAGAPVTTVPAKTLVTLVATVSSSGTSLTNGQVNFCEASAKYCTDVHVVAKAQLTTAGTASYKFIPGIGVHSYQAVFVGTNAYQGSKSAAQTLTVTSTGIASTTNTLLATGQAGDYTLTDTVTGAPYTVPTGSIPFVDTSNSNYLFGSGSLSVGARGLTFIPAPASISGIYPESTVSADFNGDGIPDLAIASGLAPAVTLWLGKGNGTFTSGPAIPANAPGIPVATADFNGDGCADLAFVNVNNLTGNPELQAALGHCDGTFTLAPFLVLQSGDVTAITAADFNHDGKVDLALATGLGTVTVFLGNGDGTFVNTSTSQTGGELLTIVAADFNGDGHMDMATASIDTTISVLYGNGDGTFQPSVNITVAPNLTGGLAVADFNGDGIPDLAVAQVAPSGVIVLLGTGTGFNALPSVATGGYPYAIATADFNGDGIPDLVTANYDDGTSTVLIGAGDGTFTPIPSIVEAGDASTTITVADFNDDGVPDLAFGDHGGEGASILLAASTSSATITGVSPVGSGTHYAQATYPGDSANAASLSNLVPLTAERVPTTLTLTAAPSGGSTVGQQVTLTAALDKFYAQDHYASGNVTFTSNGTTLGAAAVDNTGKATLTTTALAVGTDNLQATYPGDTNFVDSTSAIVPYPVSSAQVGQTISFPQPATPAFAGTSVTLTATATSQLPVTYTVISGPATVFGSTLNYTGVGTVVVEADQAGNSSFTPAPPVQRTVQVVELTEPVGTMSPTITTVVTFTAAGTLGSTAVLTQGASNLDFKFVSGGSCAAGIAYAVGDTCTVEFNFTPTRPGTRYGGIALSTGTGALLATNYIYGIGVGPQVNYLPGIESTAVSGLTQPAGLAFDGEGNLFIADARGGDVLEATAASNFATITPVGSGFTDPVGIVVDGAGNVFVSDYSANTVDEILKSGGYTKVSILGSGFLQPDGLAMDGVGNIFVADEGNDAVKELTVASGYATVNTLGSFNNPSGLGFDSQENLFVCSFGDSTVKELLAASNYATVQTVVTQGASGLAFPVALAVNTNGDLFIANQSSSAVIELLKVGGYTNSRIVTTSTNQPSGLALDGLGNVYASDSFYQHVLKFDYADPPSLTFASTPVGSTSSDSPQKVTLNNNGNAALAFGAPANGNNPAITSGFTIGASSTCPQLTASSSAMTLAPDATCTDAISFTPVAAGSDSGTLVTTDNNLNVAGSTQTVPLNGVGTTTAPTINFTVSNQTYGVPPFAVAATSNSPGKFTYSVVSGPATISGAVVTLTGTGTVVLEASQAASGAYSAGSATATFTVSKEAQVISFAAPASPVNFGVPPVTLVANASSGLPVTFSLLSGPATLNGNTLTYAGPGTVIVAANQAGNADFGPAPQVTHTIIVNARLASVGLTAAPNPVFLQNPVTLRASVSGSVGTPTGSVIFLDSSTPIGSSTLSGGTATFSISTLSLGTHSITAEYSGDSNYGPEVSPIVIVTVQDFALTATNPLVTIFHGGTATYSLILGSVGGPGLASKVTFSVTGAPDSSQITFTPSSVVTGSSTTPVTLTVQTPNYPVGPFNARNVPTASKVSLAFTVFSGLFLSFRRKRINALARMRPFSFAVLLLASTALVGLAGCGSGWRTQNFTINVTASSGNLTRMTTVYLISECQDQKSACLIEK